MDSRPVVLVTGLGRAIGIAAAIAVRCAADGWDIAFVYCSAYDARVNGGAGDIGLIESELRTLGANTLAIDVDLVDPNAPAEIFDTAQSLGPVNALVLSHAESTTGGILTSTTESFDRQMAVNARASWLLIREFASRFIARRDAAGVALAGRIVALTSDALHDELAYGASKGALDRTVFAAAREFAGAGITANLINPGPVDTGWMTDEVRQWVLQRTPLGRGGRPSDTAALVSFLLSPDGQWITGQLLNSDGGFSAP